MQEQQFKVSVNETYNATITDKTTYIVDANTLHSLIDMENAGEDALGWLKDHVLPSEEMSDILQLDDGHQAEEITVELA